MLERVVKELQLRHERLVAILALIFDAMALLIKRTQEYTETNSAEIPG